ncbi:trehalose-phosphatase [Immundisolibacter cernigliae]|uniref:trehalose-phosphatase n=1 Tax=Immundisolibacter cernigliae TaxID=1810504 RepID=UPI001F001C94|nr:trehalose-phosphatase [Immundisolibacter cernigliae]
MPDSIFLESFWSALVAAPRAVLLLDYDGTLAPFHIDPAQARPYPGVEPLLNRIGRLPNDRLVIVSGRWLQDLRPLLTLDFEPEMWGCHGRERRLSDGRHSLVPLSEAAVQALTEADSWAATVCALGGRVERKPGSLAFHWRGLAPGQQRSLQLDLEGRFAALTQAREVVWHDFDGGIELRAAGCDKGQVVSHVLAELDAGSAGCVAYLGDDHTDEDAFRALQGRGLRVLVRPKWHTTAADVWLRPPDGLREFLGRWADIRERAR